MVTLRPDILFLLSAGVAAQLALPIGLLGLTGSHRYLDRLPDAQAATVKCSTEHCTA